MVAQLAKVLPSHRAYKVVLLPAMMIPVLLLRLHLFARTTWLRGDKVLDPTLTLEVPSPFILTGISIVALPLVNPTI